MIIPWLFQYMLDAHFIVICFFSFLQHFQEKLQLMDQPMIKIKEMFFFCQVLLKSFFLVFYYCVKIMIQFVFFLDTKGLKTLKKNISLGHSV